MSEMHWPEITKDTPLAEVKRIHQAIWDYAIEHGEKPKTPYAYNCVGCEYIKLFKTYCPDCPIKWPKNDTGKRLCTIFNGLYAKWEKATGDEKTELARQIRDLPFKYELEDMQNV